MHTQHVVVNQGRTKTLMYRRRMLIFVRPILILYKIWAKKYS